MVRLALCEDREGKKVDEMRDTKIEHERKSISIVSIYINLKK
jgi:hypothetical protein